MIEQDDGIYFERWAAGLRDIINQYDRWLIFIKGSPDPDAIAASFALKLVCETIGKEASIISPLELSLPQNIKITRDLRLPIRFKPLEDVKNHFDAYVILDHQSVIVEGLTGVIPCGIHIDHHDQIPENVPVGFRVHSSRVGSTSTLIVFLVQALGVNFSESRWRDAATALYYGIQTDTDDFQHIFQWDKQAAAIVAPYADRELLKKIYTLPFSRQVLAFFRKAMLDPFYYKDWLFCNLGFISHKHRDILGIIGDYLLKRENITLSVVFAIVEQDDHMVLDASFRSRDENLNLNTLIKKITREGGARKYKGAFQVNLDYFSSCPDRDMLWQTVYKTTIEILQKRRDEAMANRLTQSLGTFKEKFHKIFSKG